MKANFVTGEKAHHSAVKRRGTWLDGLRDTRDNARGCETVTEPQQGAAAVAFVSRMRVNFGWSVIRTLCSTDVGFALRTDQISYFA